MARTTSTTADNRSAIARDAEAMARMRRIEQAFEKKAPETLQELWDRVEPPSPFSPYEQNLVQRAIDGITEDRTARLTRARGSAYRLDRLRGEKASQVEGYRRVIRFLRSKIPSRLRNQSPFWAA
jgi:hypothetical protein